MSFWLRYVPRAQVAVYEAQGWRVVSQLQRSSHGVWSVLMRRDA